jgi:hypothetical protein
MTCDSFFAIALGWKNMQNSNISNIYNVTKTLFVTSICIFLLIIIVEILIFPLDTALISQQGLAMVLVLILSSLIDSIPIISNISNPPDRTLVHDII